MSDMSAALPTPEIDAINQPYWAALAQGRLDFQLCACGHAWLPPRAACPQCLGTQWTWKTAAGLGRIKSWVVYHVAYHEAFKDRLPYNVAIVQLDEGPSLITNVIGATPEQLTADAPVRLAIARDGPFPLAQFMLMA